MITQACHLFPIEAEACCLWLRAQNWPRGEVRCIVLAKARWAPEYVNLSQGCLGFVAQFALDTGMPRFCHRKDLGKTVLVALPGGMTAKRRLVPSWPLNVPHNRRALRVRNLRKRDGSTTAPPSGAGGKLVQDAACRANLCDSKGDDNEMASASASPSMPAASESDQGSYRGKLKRKHGQFMEPLMPEHMIVGNNVQAKYEDGIWYNGSIDSIVSR